MLFVGESGDVAPSPLLPYQYFDARKPTDADWSTLVATIRSALKEPAPQKMRVRASRFAIARSYIRRVRDDALAALHELNSRTPRLLIFDNAANQQSIERWLPTSGGCKTIITSHFTGWSAAIAGITVDTLEPGAARPCLQAGSELRAQERGRCVAKAFPSDCG